MRNLLVVLAAGLTLAAATSAQAQNQVVQGRITNISFSSPGNFSMRVTLDTTLTQCSNNFVFLDTSFGNYQAYAAGLMSAYALSKPINVTYTVQSNGFCAMLEYSY